MREVPLCQDASGRARCKAHRRFDHASLGWRRSKSEEEGHTLARMRCAKVVGTRKSGRDQAYLTQGTRQLV